MNILPKSTHQYLGNITLKNLSKMWSKTIPKIYLWLPYDECDIDFHKLHIIMSFLLSDIKKNRMIWSNWDGALSCYLQSIDGILRTWASTPSQIITELNSLRSTSLICSYEQTDLHTTWEESLWVDMEISTTQAKIFSLHKILDCVIPPQIFNFTQPHQCQKALICNV
jgi:hypothetical protein